MNVIETMKGKHRGDKLLQKNIQVFYSRYYNSNFNPNITPKNENKAKAAVKKE